MPFHMYSLVFFCCPFVLLACVRVCRRIAPMRVWHQDPRPCASSVCAGILRKRVDNFNPHKGEKKKQKGNKTHTHKGRAVGGGTGARKNRRGVRSLTRTRARKNNAQGRTRPLRRLCWETRAPRKQNFATLGTVRNTLGLNRSHRVPLGVG